VRILYFEKLFVTEAVSLSFHGFDFVVRRKRSVGQEMDENQTAFSVRTEIHFRAD